MALVAKRLEELGIKLPHPAASVANYVGFTRVGTLLSKGPESFGNTR